jgi:NhaA family Na+:H+ antiporter
VPASLKTFLLALAIIDDLMAIIVIAIFYTADLSVTALALGGLGVAVLAVLNLLDVRRASFYLIAGSPGSACSSRAYMRRWPASPSVSRCR